MLGKIIRREDEVRTRKISECFIFQQGWSLSEAQGIRFCSSEVFGILLTSSFVHSSFHLSIRPPNKYLLRAYAMQGSFLVAGNTMNTSDKNPCPHGACILLEIDRQIINKKYEKYVMGDK